MLLNVDRLAQARRFWPLPSRVICRRSLIQMQLSRRPDTSPDFQICWTVLRLVQLAAFWVQLFKMTFIRRWDVDRSSRRPNPDAPPPMPPPPKKKCKSCPRVREGLRQLGARCDVDKRIFLFLISVHFCRFKKAFAVCRISKVVIIIWS